MGKILIIDDEKQMLALLSRILELEGYEVYRTATCKAGLRQLQVNTPEVVLRDVCLPDGNGIELIDRMKNISPSTEGTEKVSLQLFKELNLHIACILFGYVQIFCTLMP